MSDRDPVLQRRSHRTSRSRIGSSAASRRAGGTRAVASLVRREGHASRCRHGNGRHTGASAKVRARRKASPCRCSVSTGVFELVKATREWPVAGVLGDALALPFATGSFDFVIASQVLHHFAGGRRDPARARDAPRGKATRRDCRPQAELGGRGRTLARILSARFSRVSRHDGVVSILRGFEANGAARPDSPGNWASAPDVQRRTGWRVTASWTPEPDGGGRRADGS